MRGVAGVCALSVGSDVQTSIVHVDGARAFLL